MREEQEVTEEEMGAVEAEFTVVMPRATSRPDARPVSLRELDHRSLIAEVVRLRRQVAAMQAERDADASRDTVRAAIDAAKMSAHRCGVQGFDAWLGDRCPGCEGERIAREATP